VVEHYCLFETAIGACGVAWSDRGVTRLQLPERSRSATERRLRGRGANASAGVPPAAVSATIRLLERYFAGEQVDLSGVALDLSGVSPFHRKIYDAARALAWGKTATYGELAQQAGARDATRAVGQAMGKNPVPIIIPCHRVLAAGGKIGGFSAHGGTSTKQRLLTLEGVHLGHSTFRCLDWAGHEDPQAVASNSSRPISQRRISLVPAPIS
jgi:methylated-DNA-[protein]-cysteine S-methyltransferase